MKIRARVSNEGGRNDVSLSTNDNVHSIDIPAKTGGKGSQANGGELLFLALATCYCNDIYREASARGITVLGVDVEVDGEFGSAGEPARNIKYRVRLKARGATEQQARELLKHTDTVAEIHNTLRKGVEVRLDVQQVEIIETAVSDN
jgi:organic hydroperoxide reductase OsmC/OhrA